MSTSKKRCRYCCKEGHNILYCNDTGIDELIQDTKKDIEYFYTKDDLEIYLNTKSHIELAMLAYKEKNMKTTLTRKLYLRELTKHYTKHQVSKRISTDNYLLSLMNRFPHLSLEQIMFKRYVELANIFNVNETNLAIFSDNVLNDSIDLSKRTLPTMTMDIITGSVHAVNYISNIIANNPMKDWEISIGHCKDDITKLQEVNECGICYDAKSKNHFVSINCNHEFCSDCTNQYFDTCRENSCIAKCPMCRTPITNINVRSQNHYDEFVNKYSVSPQTASLE